MTWIGFLAHLSHDDLLKVQDKIDENPILYGHSFRVRVDDILYIHYNLNIGGNEYLRDQYEFPNIDDEWVRDNINDWSKNGIDELKTCTDNQDWLELIETMYRLK